MDENISAAATDEYQRLLEENLRLRAWVERAAPALAEVERMRSWIARAQVAMAAGNLGDGGKVVASAASQPGRSRPSGERGSRPARTASGA